MARKKKKLNKRLIVVLSVLGFIVLAGLLALVIARSPMNHAAFAEQARKFTDARDYRSAEKLWASAVGSAKDPTIRAEYQAQLAKVRIEWVKSDPTLSRQMRLDLIGRAQDTLLKALGDDRDNIDANELICNLLWESSHPDDRICAASNAPVNKEFLDRVNSLIRVKPREAQNYFRRALALTHLTVTDGPQYFDEAVASFRKAIELEGDNYVYWTRLVEFYDRFDKVERMEPTFKEALARNPDTPELRVQYAMWLQRNKRPTEAMAEIRRSVEGAPHNPTGKIAEANLYLMDGKREQAVASLQAARDIDPGDYRAYAALARVFSDERNYSRAAQELRDGLAAVGRRTTSGPASQPSRDARIAAIIGRLQLHEALANCLLDMLPRTAADDRAALLQEARDSFAELSKMLPTDYRTRKIEGRLALIDGKKPDALRSLEAANAGYDGGDPQTISLLIALYREMNMPTSSERLVDGLLAQPQNRNNPNLLLLKAELELEYGAVPDAIKHVQQVQELQPNNVQVKNLVRALQLAESNPSAIPSDLEITGGIANLLLMKATAAWDSGRRDQATSLLESLNKRAPQHVGVASRLASYYAAADRRDDARALLERTLGLVAADPAAQKQLESVAELVAAATPEERYKVRLAMADRAATPLERAIQKARVAQAFNKMDDFSQFLSEAEKIDANSGTVVAMLFGQALARKDWASAEAYVKRAKEKNLDEAQGRRYQAQLSMAQGKFDEGLAIVQQLSTERPEDKQLRVMLGDCYQSMRNLERAAQCYSQALEYDRGFEPALVRMAQVSERMGRPADSRRYIDMAYRAGSRDPYVLRLRLRNLEIEDAPAAVREREQILAQNPGDLENATFLGALYERTGEPAKAEKAFRHVLDRGEDKLSAAVPLAGFYARSRRASDLEALINDLLAKGMPKTGVEILHAQALSISDPGRALAAFDEAIKASPASADGYVMKARFLSRRGQHADAAAAMAKAIEVDSSLQGREQELELVEMLIAARQFDPAAARLDRMMRERPDNLMLMLMRTSLLVAKGDLKGAEEVASQCVRQFPTSADPLVRRSTIYQAQGEMEKVRLDMEAAAKLSDAPSVGNRLAEVYLQLMDVEKARTAYSEVRTRNPDNEAATVGLANIYLASQNWRQLAPLLAEARKASPGNARYWLLEAQMRKANNDKQGYLQALQQAVSLEPSGTEGAALLLAALMESQQTELLTRYIEQFIKDPAVKPLALAAATGPLTTQKRPEADGTFLAAFEGAPPSMYPSLVNLGLLGLGEQTVVAKALAYVQARPADWQLAWHLSGVCNNAGDLQASEKCLLLALKAASDPRDKGAVQLSLGTVYLQMFERGLKDRDYGMLSKDALSAALEVDPLDVRALNNMAYLLINDLKQVQAGLPYAERAARQRPDARVLDTYGWALAQLGQYDRAEQQLVRAVKFEERLAAARLHLGFVYEKTSRAAEASKEYRQGQAMVGKDDPMYAEFEAALKRVQR
jgi:tetratricopeptide (TPR) repeat protein